MPKVATLINDLVADDDDDDDDAESDSDKSWIPLLSWHLNSINHFGGHYRFTFLSHLLNWRQLHLLARLDLAVETLLLITLEYTTDNAIYYIYIYITHFLPLILTLSILILQMANLSNCPTIWRACQERTVSHRSDIAGIQMRSV